MNISDFIKGKVNTKRVLKVFAACALTAGSVAYAIQTVYPSIQVGSRIEAKERDLEEKIIKSATSEEALKNQGEYIKFNKELKEHGVEVKGVGSKAEVPLFTKSSLEKYGTKLNKDLLGSVDNKSIEANLKSRNEFNKYLYNTGLEVVNVSNCGEITIGRIEK